MISRWFVRRRGTANSIAISGTGMGPASHHHPTCVFLKTLGWRTSYSILGIANAAVLVPLVLAGVRSHPRSQSAGAQGNGDGVVVGSVESLGTVTEPAADELSAALSQVLVSRQFWLLITLYAACGFQDFFVATHVVAFALDQGIGSVLAGNILALMGLTGLIWGVVVWGSSRCLWCGTSHCDLLPDPNRPIRFRHLLPGHRQYRCICPLVRVYVLNYSPTHHSFRE